MRGLARCLGTLFSAVPVIVVSVTGCQTLTGIDGFYAFSLLPYITYLLM